MPTAAQEYHVRLRSRGEREATISTSVSATTEQRDFHDFRNQVSQLPLVRVPEDYLVYRMENFRTYTDQNEFIRREKKESDFFKIGQESETVQQLQHEILAKLAKQGTESVTPVIDVLRAEGQREPLLITRSGVVVNGNRRLAAIRELFGVEKIPTFGYVDCLVLPADATTAEIVDIEAALQAKPQTRLDYDWIGDCQLIQTLLNLGRSPEQVGTQLNRKPSEITNSIAALVEANLYLKDWAKAEGEYRRVLDAEQLFKDLPTLLQNKNAAQAEASRVVAWNLLDNRSKLGGRLYAFNSVISKHAAQVLGRISTTLDLPSAHLTSTTDLPFAIDLEESSDTSLVPAIEALRQGEKKEEASEILVETSRDILEAERSKKGQSAALKAITAALGRLSEVNLGAAEAATYDAIEQSLNKIIERATGLKSLLTRLKDDAE